MCNLFMSNVYRLYATGESQQRFCSFIHNKNTKQKMLKCMPISFQSKFKNDFLTVYFLNFFFNWGIVAYSSLFLLSLFFISLNEAWHSKR